MYKLMQRLEKIQLLPYYNKLNKENSFAQVRVNCRLSIPCNNPSELTNKSVEQFHTLNVFHRTILQQNSPMGSSGNGIEKNDKK